MKLAHLPLLVLFALWILVPSKVRAQCNGDDPVVWIGEYPNEKQNENSGVLNRTSAILLGKKHSVISKPFAIQAINPEHYFILDQGSGYICKVNEGKLTNPKAWSKNKEEFASLVDFCILPGGDMLFTDSQKNRIFKLTADEKNIELFGDTGSLSRPTGIAYSSKTNEIYVIETSSHSIRILDTEGNYLRTLGKNGVGEGEFNFPTNIWIDAEGNLYIVDSMNFRVQIFNSEGKLISIFGKTGDGSGDFMRPKGIATDTYGNIYVVDALFHAVQVFNREGRLLHVFGGQGREQGKFWMPSGIFIDKQNYIYVADTYNCRIQIFKLCREE